MWSCPRRQVYYGFSEKFVAWGKANMRFFDEWMSQMERLLDQEGVVYKGECGVASPILHETTLRIARTGNTQSSPRSSSRKLSNPACSQTREIGVIVYPAHSSFFHQPLG